MTLPRQIGDNGVMQHWQPRIILLLSVVGIVIAFYLKLYHDGVLFLTCEVDGIFDCGQVSGTYGEYSTLFGIPVATIGLLGYITIFGVIWLQDWLPLVKRQLPLILLVLISVALAFSAYLSALEAFVIGAWCQYCLYSAAIIIVMFLLTVSYWRSTRRDSNAP
jgi:uncharacterized membrane protein